MRIFNKKLLRSLSQLTVQRGLPSLGGLYSNVSCGFARNFKSKNDESAEGNDAGESDVKIPKFRNVSDTNSEATQASERLDDIVLPKRGGDDFKRGEGFRPRRNFGEEGEGEGGFRPRRDFGDREGGFRPRRNFGDRDGDREGGFRPRRNFGDRDGDREGGFRPRSDFGDREGGFRPRRNFGDDKFGDRPRFNRSADEGEGEGGFRPRRDFGDRPRRDFGDREGGFRPRRNFGEEGQGEGEGGFRPRRDFGDREGGYRPRREFGDREGGEGGFRPRRDFGDRPRRDFGDREGGEGGFRPRRDFGDRPRRDFGDRPKRFERDNKPAEENEEALQEDLASLNPENETEEIKTENTTGNSNNRITLSELKNNRRRSNNLDSDISKVDNADEILKSEATPSKFRVNKAAEKPTEESATNEESEEITYEFKDSKMDYLYGAHAVEAALSFNFRKNLDLFVQWTYKDNTPEHVKRIVDLAKNKNVKIKYLVKDKMDRFTGGRPHNGLVLKSQPRDYIYVSNFQTFAEKFVHKAEGNLLVLLDQIVDPQNFGSVIRTAFFLGSDALLMNKNNKPPLSATVCKVSSGASECLDLFSVKNMRKFLGQAIAKEWTVVTTSIEKDHDVQLRINSEASQEKETEEETKENNTKTVNTQNISLTELNVPKGANVILVLGSEANGIVSDLSGVSNFNVYIPPLLNKELTGKHPFNIIDSLNVGVSAGIIINHIKASLKGLNVQDNTQTEQKVERGEMH